MTACYLYCVVRAAKKPATLEAPEGLPGASRPIVTPVTTSLWLVTADVPLDMYGGAHLERSLADLDWVGRTAVAHEQVVEYFASRRSLTVIPMKLFTMFSSVERAAAEIASRKGSIERAMRRVTGAEEWGLRILRAATPVPPAMSSQPAASGAAFLAAKKQARDEAKQARFAAAEAAILAFERLSRLAREARRREITPAAGATPPLLDAAFLVPLTKRSAFTKAAEREAKACAGAGAQMTITGPWPAYNFVVGEEGS